ncbi:MAG: hypothetical protein R2749_12980 [Acidimicrobiales bacterium]
MTKGGRFAYMDHINETEGGSITDSGRHPEAHADYKDDGYDPARTIPLVDERCSTVTRCSP